MEGDHDREASNSNKALGNINWLVMSTEAKEPILVRSCQSPALGRFFLCSFVFLIPMPEKLSSSSSSTSGICFSSSRFPFMPPLLCGNARGGGGGKREGKEVVSRRTDGLSCCLRLQPDKLYLPPPPPPVVPPKHLLRQKRIIVRAFFGLRFPTAAAAIDGGFPWHFGLRGSFSKNSFGSSSETIPGALRLLSFLAAIIGL